MASDALLNCMTATCCPPAAQANALAAAMVDEGICAEEYEAHKIARWYIKNFDFAEKGTLEPLRKSIIRLHKAKGPDA
jgi:hypothetical protein